MKYYAINMYDDVWLEGDDAKNFDEALEKLGRNNPQFFLTENELVKIIKQALERKNIKDKVLEELEQ